MSNQFYYLQLYFPSEYPEVYKVYYLPIEITFLEGALLLSIESQHLQMCHIFWFDTHTHNGKGLHYGENDVVGPMV